MGRCDFRLVSIHSVCEFIDFQKVKDIASMVTALVWHSTKFLCEKNDDDNISAY